MALADMAAGAGDAVQQLLRRRMQEQQMAAQLQAQAFNQQNVLADNRRQDEQQDMMRQQHAASLGMQQFNLGGSVAEQIPADAFLQEDDPAVGLLQNAGRGSLLTKTPEFKAVGPDFAGPQQDGITPEQAAVGRPGGFLKMATAAQQNTATDNARQAEAESNRLKVEADRLKSADAARASLDADRSADNDRQTARDASTERHQREMERLAATNASGGTNSGAGWTIQQFTDPATNQTKLVRVNSRTGETSPVQGPEGLQAGGQRQTRLSTGQQEDLATMKTVEDLGNKLVQIGEQTKWQGVGGMMHGTIAAFSARNFGTGSTEAETLRNYIGNVQATIAKLRGGTSFTPNEQKLLESYTPTVDMDPKIIKAKVASLNEFIAIKRRNTIQFAGGAPAAAEDGTPAQAPPPGKITIKSIRQVN